MIRGSVFKRCQCRDGDGRRVKGCGRPHGSWGYTFDVGPRGSGLRQHRRQVMRSGFASRDAAEKALAGELSRLATGVWLDDRNLTLGWWLQTWLSMQMEAGRSVKTLANYHGHVRDIWTPALGEARLRDLRRADVVQVLMKALEPTGGKGDGRAVRGTVPAGGGGQSGGRGNVGRRVERRSVSTVEGYRRTLRSALSAAQRQGLIVVNPAMGPIDGLTWLAPTDVAVGPRAWEPVQTAAFLEFITGAGARLTALFEVAAYTGLRRGELCGLRWSDLDADGRGLSVRHNVVEVARDRIPVAQRRCTLCGGEHVGRVLKGPKSRAGRRWVPLAVPAQTALRGQRAGQAVDRRRPYRDHDLVFATPDGDPLRPNAVSAEFSQLVRACGLPQIRLHDLRHGACSLLLAGGVPLEVVQMILGHAAPSVTRRVYAHILRDPTAEQVNQAADLITRHIPTPSLVSRSTCPVSNGEHP